MCIINLITDGRIIVQSFGGFSETCRGVSVSVSTLWCSGVVTDNRQEGEGDISIPA